MRKGFISISESQWQAMEPNLSNCAGITITRTAEQRIGTRAYRIICFTYLVLQDVCQLFAFGQQVEKGHGNG